MYAVIETGGKQFKVEKHHIIHVPKLECDVGAQVELDAVLLLSDGDAIAIGTPHVPQAKVIASVLDHRLDDKVIIFKKKRRKGFRKKRGHRQDYTELMIEDIVAAR